MTKQVLSRGPRIIDGTFHRIRRTIFLVVTVLFLLFPWIIYDDRQGVLLNVADRMFFIFSFIFWPQNIIFFALLLIILALSLFIIAAWGGRIFCGFICPQTHFVAAFRRIARRVDTLVGKSGLVLSWRHTLANAISWILITLFSVYLGFTLTGYFSPIRHIIPNILDGHGWLLFWVIVLSATLWICCAWMQERICEFLCPYARFQGVMVDPDTLLVSYVGRPPKGADSREDCGRCRLCQAVCPVEIDIRDGSQYFCIGCAACVDACHTISSVKGFEAPLVQFSSIKQQKKQQRLSFNDIFLRPRILGYLVLLLTLVISLLWMIYSRPVIKMNILRDRIVLSRVEDDRIENMYTCLFINQTNQVQTLQLTAEGLPFLSVDSGQHIALAPLSSKRALVVASVPQSVADDGMHTIRFVVQSAEHNTVFLREATTFLVEKTVHQGN